ncbi:MAG: PAS domain S-box protein, partial [bacterium]|nr:PAS domain S-box protein [bacterium]
MTDETKTCPVSGLPILEKPHWKEIRISGDFVVTYRMIGGRILYAEARGHSAQVDVEKLLNCRDQILTEAIGEDVKVVEISDYADIIGFPSPASRREVSRYFVRKAARCLGFIAFSVPWKLRAFMRVALKFRKTPYPFEIKNNYEEAVKRALQLVRLSDFHTGFEPGNFVAREEWKYQADGFSAEFRVLSKKILYSVLKGYLQRHHVSPAIQILNRIFEGEDLELPGYYHIADFSAVTGSTWPGRLKTVKALRRIDAAHSPPAAILIIGGSRIVLTSLKMVEKSMGLQFEFVPDLDRALSRIIEWETHGGKPPQTSAHADRDDEKKGLLAKKYTTEIMDYIASFSWDSPGKKIKEVDDSHPFKSVFDAIHLLKLDIDALLKERTMAQLQLMEKEEHYRNLFRNSADAIILADKNGIFDCNEATLKMFKAQKSEEIMGKHPWDLASPIQPDGTESHNLAQTARRLVMENGVHRFEWILQRRDGEMFPADVLLNRMELGGKMIFQGVMRDITERKKAVEEIKRARAEAEFANNAKSQFLANMS